MRNQAVKYLQGTSVDLDRQQSPRGSLIAPLSWTTEGHLQTAVPQDQDSTRGPALKIANHPKQVRPFVCAGRMGGNVKHHVSNSLSLSAVRRKAQTSRAVRKTEEAVAEPIRTTDSVSSSTT